MAYFHPENFSDEELEEFDAFMARMIVTPEQSSAIADLIWGQVLKELGQRGKVILVEGSYEDIGNALIRRIQP